MTYRHPIYFSPRTGQPDSNAVFPAGAFDYTNSAQVTIDSGGDGSATLPAGCHMCRVRIVSSTAEVQYRADGTATFDDDMPALTSAFPMEDIVVTDPSRVIHFKGTENDVLAVTPYLVVG